MTAAQQSIPSVPEGTPGRDWRSALPQDQGPGPRQPWRRLGPGNRTWVVVVTVLAVIIMAVLAMVAVGCGVLTSAFDQRGVVVLEGSEYGTRDNGACGGVGDAEGIEGGTAITFSDGRTTLKSTLKQGTLKSGRCQLPFDLDIADIGVGRGGTYQVTVGNVVGTPTTAAELAGSDSVLVYLVPRGAA